MRTKREQAVREDGKLVQTVSSVAIESLRDFLVIGGALLR